MKQYYPSKHAVQQMSARDVSWADVLHVLDFPEVKYVNRETDGPGKAEVHQRGNLYVVVSLEPTKMPRHAESDTDYHAVITVGLRQSDQWNNSDVRNRSNR